MYFYLDYMRFLFLVSMFIWYLQTQLLVHECQGGLFLKVLSLDQWQRSLYTIEINQTCFMVYCMIAYSLRDCFQGSRWKVIRAKSPCEGWLHFLVSQKRSSSRLVILKSRPMSLPHIFSTCHLWKCRHRAHVYWNLSYPLLSILKVNADG
jgi:hypothetical protein